MKSMNIKDTYPIQYLELNKRDMKFSTMDEIVAYMEQKIESHPVAVHIATFDHYTHTKNLPEHDINEDIIDAQIVVLCFGKELPIPQMAAVRPRGIAIVEEKNKFTISFMDAPNPQAHEAMIEWTLGAKK